MRIVATFDPSTSTSDTFNAGFPNGTGKMVVYNESNINLQLSWDTFSTYCPAWTAMLYCVSTSNVNINWAMQSQLVSNQAPISQVIVEVFDPGEQVIGTFPAPLVRQTNIGNASTVATAATSIQNDGNVAGTSIIEATVAGDGTSAITCTNDAKLTVGDTAHPGALVVNGAGSTTSLDNGKLVTDGNGNAIWGGKLGISTTGDILDTVGGGAGNTFLKGANSVQLQVPSGTNRASIDSSGINLLSGNISLIHGSLSRFSKFTGVGSGTVAHGLGTTPDIILCNPCTTNLSSQTIGFGNRDGTNVTVTTGAGLAWEALAIKF